MGTSRGARTPRRTLPPCISWTVTVTSPPITSDSPTRRCSTRCDLSSYTVRLLVLLPWRSPRLPRRLEAPRLFPRRFHVLGAPQGHVGRRAQSSAHRGDGLHQGAAVAL